MSDLGARVAALEERVADEAGLRAAVDRDLSTLVLKVSATQAMVQALHFTQQEHGQRFERLEAGMQAIKAMLEELLRRSEGGDPR